MFLLIALGAMLPSTVFAYQKTKIDLQPQNDFVVEPGKTEVLLNPGETMTKNVSVTNRTERTVHFTLTTEDFVGTDDVNQPVVLLGGERGPYTLKDFIKPELTEFTLAFGEKITFAVNISVPNNAEPIGHYGALVIANQPEELTEEQTNETQGKTRIVSRIGSLFLLKVNGQGKESGQITDFKVSGPSKFAYEHRPSGFEIAFKNTGNVHLVPYGTITIKSMIGKTIDTIPVDAYFVLPDATRYREVLWDEGFGLGRYTATLSLYKGYGEEYETAKVAFWVLPWKILVATFIVLALIISLIYYFTTRFELKRK